MSKTAIRIKNEYFYVHSSIVHAETYFRMLCKQLLYAVKVLLPLWKVSLNFKRYSKHSICLGCDEIKISHKSTLVRVSLRPNFWVWPFFGWFFLNLDRSITEQRSECLHHSCIHWISRASENILHLVSSRRIMLNSIDLFIKVHWTRPDDHEATRRCIKLLAFSVDALLSLINW